MGARMTSYRIAIAGAGTGGLAAAAFLQRDGHQVQLFERFQSARPLGAGLMVQPTGLAALACLGLDEAALGYGRVMRGITGHTIAGRTIFRTRYDVLGPGCFGLAMHRAALFDVLFRAVERQGVVITGNTAIASSRLVGAERVLADQSGAEHGPFDLVIDATGTRSPLRDQLARVRYNRPYPYGAVWGVIEEPNGWAHPHHLLQRYDGARIMIGLLPIGRRPEDDRALAALFWSLPAAAYAAWRATPFARWQEEVAMLWPDAAPFVSQFKSHDDLTFASYADIFVAPPYGERIVFIGDAARSASPQLGQGANLALIDAMILADRLKGATPVGAALVAYAAARVDQTRFYALASRLLTPFFQSNSRVAGAMRDLTFWPMAHVPYIEREMVRMLSGMKTGLFSHLDPGDWHPRYALVPSRQAQ
jgi:2-polyprenyl-6-methoxyphenol hydroxylase-like FAD-dependent oxidoreductase